MKINLEEKCSLAFAYNLVYELYTKIKRNRTDTKIAKEFRIKIVKERLYGLQSILKKVGINGIEFKVFK